jgi:hypothetical protein
MRDHHTTQRQAWLYAMQHGTPPDTRTLYRDALAALLGALALLVALWI